MPASTKLNVTNWQVTRDSDTDATDEGPGGSIILSPKYEYLGAAYIPRGDEILVVFASNIPPGGHTDNEDDNRIGHGVAFINPNSDKGISADNTDLIAVRFGEHHNEIPAQYRKPTGAFKDFALDSVTDENGRLANFDLGDYVQQVADRNGTVAYGESQRVDETYLGGLSNSVKNEIEGGNLIAESGYRKLTVQEKEEAAKQFVEQGIGGEYIEGFAISKSLVPLGASTISLWAECGNDHIALDILNIGNPDIEVVKRVNGLDAKTPAAAALIEDEQKVVYTIELSNTGDVNLTADSISVVDPGTPLFLLPFTDAGSDNILSPGETWSYAAAPAEPDPMTRIVLDFDYAADGTALKAGDSIATQYASLGVERISGEYTYNPALITQVGDDCKGQVTQEILDEMAQNPFGTMIFDTENPTGEDEDLRTPDQSMALIISEDGDTTDPDDNCFGGTFIFEFDAPVFAEGLGFVDLDAVLGIKGFLNDTLVHDESIEVRKPKAQFQADLTQILSTPIDRLELSTRDSFALSQLSFIRPVENKVDVTITDPNGLFTISASDSAFYLNSAAETEAPRSLLSSPSRPDLSGDSQPDLLWRNSNDGMNVLWAINNFESVSSTVHSTIEDTNWDITTYDDFDGDGNADLLLRHKGVGVNLIRRLGADGTTVLGDIQLPDIPDLNWDFIDTADFDKDGNVDILMRHQVAGVNLIWNLDGSGELERTTSLAPIEDTNWVVAASADFNKDGNVDLLLRHQEAGINLIRQLDGVEVLGDVRLPDAVGNSLHIEGARDFNGDGSVDIVWRDRATGANSIWELNGTEFVRSVALASVDSSWLLTV